MSEQMDPKAKSYETIAPDATQWVPPSNFGKGETLGGLMWKEAQPPKRIASLCYEFPLRADFSAQLVLPRDLTQREVGRMCAFLQSLPMPAAADPAAHTGSTPVQPARHEDSPG